MASTHPRSHLRLTWPSTIPQHTSKPWPSPIWRKVLYSLNSYRHVKYLKADLWRKRLACADKTRRRQWHANLYDRKIYNQCGNSKPTAKGFTRSNRQEHKQHACTSKSTERWDKEGSISSKERPTTKQPASLEPPQMFKKNAYFYAMTTLQVDILNPKAGKLLEDLAELKLISIRKGTDDGFLKLVNKFRAKAKNTPPTLEEITKEVEIVRSKRYAKAKR
jgi:hypothetical protein